MREIRLLALGAVAFGIAVIAVAIHTPSVSSLGGVVLGWGLFMLWWDWNEARKDQR